MLSVAMERGRGEATAQLISLPSVMEENGPHSTNCKSGYEGDGIMLSLVRRVAVVGAAFAVVACALLFPPLHAGATTTWIVTNCTDSGVSGDGSLRGEILAAGNNDTI